MFIYLKIIFHFLIKNQGVGIEITVTHNDALLPLVFKRANGTRSQHNIASFSSTLLVILHTVAFQILHDAVWPHQSN